MQSSVSLITAYCTNTNNQYLIRDWSLIIIMGGGGGYNMGKSQLRNFLCVPLEPRSSLLCPPFEGVETFGVPPFSLAKT